MSRKKIGEILCDEGVLDETGLRAALIEQQRWGGPLGRILVDMQLLDEGVLVDVLSRQLHLPSVDLDQQTIPIDVIELVPGEVCEHYGVIPFAAASKFLDLAMADPTNLSVVDDLQIRTHLNVRPHLAGPKAIERAIVRHYRRGGALRRSPTSPIALELGGVLPDGVLEDAADPDAERAAEVTALQQRVSRLEALVARDEVVLRKVLTLLVEKGVATREEIVERIK